MDPVRTESRAASDAAVGTDGGPGVASWGVWETYYKEASRRRRASGGRTKLREEKRRRRIKERIGIGVSALFVTALTAVFYFVLTR
jgi:hypothetical protein